MTSARFQELEQRAIAIRKRNYIILSISAFVLFSLIYLMSIALFLPKTPKVSSDIMSKKHQVKIVKKSVIVKKTTSKSKKKKINSKNEESYNTIKLSSSINLKRRNYISSEVEIKKNITKIELEPVRKVKLDFRVREVKSEKALLERFRVATDFESAIALATIYFNTKQFNKAIIWSKKASNLSSKIDSSWLIFAKSKKAIGKTKEAVDSLELYLKYFNSRKIKKLLKLYRGKK